MKGLNKAQIIGNLGANPKLSYTPNGTPRCAFSVAVNEKRKDQTGEWRDQVEWIHVVAWGKLAEICGQYLSKGSGVFVEGKMRQGSYEKDGQTIKTFEVVAFDVNFLGGGSGGGQRGGSQASGGYQSQNGGAGGSVPDDDIPF